jgi:uncharacterized protein
MGLRSAVVFASCVLVSLSADVRPVQSELISELYFSEYIEGTSNNKALEIYNGTNGPIDLAMGGYSVQMFANGSPTASLTLNLAGIVAPGDVFVVAQSSASAGILAEADQTTGIAWFNGDDTVVLRKGTEMVDVIGQIGFDPGIEWGTGLASTADNTLRRRSTVLKGDTNGYDEFNPLMEWEGFATDSFGGLGTHTTVPVPPSVYLLGAGILCLGSWRKRLSSKK